MKLQSLSSPVAMSVLLIIALAQSPVQAQKAAKAQGEVPLCGPFVNTNVTTQVVGRDLFGDCASKPNVHFRYSRTVTEDVYDNGSKFYCSNWTPQGCYPAAVTNFPDCPDHTCTNPE